jgi:hypothetical protein
MNLERFWSSVEAVSLRENTLSSPVPAAASASRSAGAPRAMAAASRSPHELTGKLCIDDEVVAAAGTAGLVDDCAMDPNAQLLPDYFI